MRDDLIDQPSRRPTRKVGAQAIGAALATIAVVGVKALWPEFDVTGLEGALAVLIGLIVGYFVRDRRTDADPV